MFSLWSLEWAAPGLCVHLRLTQVTVTQGWAMFLHHKEIIIAPNQAALTAGFWLVHLAIFHALQPHDMEWMPG